MRYVTHSRFLPAGLARLLSFTALGSAALLFTPTLSAQHCIAQNNTNSAQTTQSAQVTSPGGCGGPVGGGGGGGTGGGGTPASSGVLTWNYTTSTNAPQAGGDSQREGVGAAVFNGYLYVAYTGRNVFDSRGDAPVYFVASSGDGSSITSGYQANLDPGSAQTIASNANPAIAASTNPSYSDRLYMAINDGYGNTGLVVGKFDSSKPGSVDWGSNIYGFGGGVDGSPALAFYTNPATGHELLYMAVRMSGDHSLTIVAIDPLSLNSTITNFPGATLGFSPGLGTFNGQLYIGIQANDNSHNIYYFTTTDGQNISFSAATKGDQTSTTPSFATHNGTLYLGFRSNDGDHKFLYKYSTDGANWSGANQGSGPYQGSYSMGGNPTLVDGATLNPSYSPYGAYLLNTYVSDDGNFHIFGSEAK